LTDKLISAYFRSPSDAEGVAAKLRALRVPDVQIERVDPFSMTETYRVENPITGDFPGLAAIVNNATSPSRDTAILAAAFPVMSGMSDGSRDDSVGLDVLLTALVNDEIYDKAVHVVKESGGRL